MKNTYFHITARTSNNLYFTKPISVVWKECLNNLQASQEKFDADIISFLLMNNHYHLILKISDSNKEAFMNKFSPDYLRNYNCYPIDSQVYLKHTYKYIYQNPLRAKISSKVQTYPYSSLYHLYNKLKLPFKAVDKFGFIDEFKLYWLNQPIH